MPRPPNDDEIQEMAEVASAEYAQRVRVSGGPASGKALTNVMAGFSDGFETGARWARQVTSSTSGDETDDTGQ